MFNGKTALVTGSTSGIGLGIATELAQRGANVILNGFGEAETVTVEDAPMASMYGLAGRVIRLPRQPQEEERKVVRLSRPKGAAGKKRRRR